MKRLRRVVFSCVVLAASLTFAQRPALHRDPALGRRPVPQKSFFDWVMDRVNPQDIDYGQRIEDVRQTAIMATIDDYYFWSNLAATGALSMMFLIVWWQHRQNQRMRHSTARIVTGYYNELAVARDQITRLSTEYTQAKRMLAEQLAANLAPKALLARQESAPGSSGNQGVGGSVSNGQPGRDQLQAENEGLKQQVRILTLKCQEEQQRNRKLKGE